MAARKNTTPAQIINHLRKAEVELASGKTIREVCKGLGISVPCPTMRYHSPR